jgi:hypothetical protein
MAALVERCYVFTGNDVFVFKTNVGQHPPDDPRRPHQPLRIRSPLMPVVHRALSGMSGRSIVSCLARVERSRLAVEKAGVALPGAFLYGRDAGQLLATPGRPTPPLVAELPASP